MPLTDVERNVVGAVVDTYLKTKNATARRELLVKFKDRAVIDRLVSQGVLRHTGNNDAFLPTAAAFGCCGDSDTQERSRRALEVVFAVLKHLFVTELDKTDFTRAEIQEQTRALFGEVNANVIQFGLYLAKDVGILSGYGPDDGEGVSFVRVSETIIAHEGIEQLWNNYIQQAVRGVERARKQEMQRAFELALYEAIGDVEVGNVTPMQYTSIGTTLGMSQSEIGGAVRSLVGAGIVSQKPASEVLVVRNRFVGLGFPVGEVEHTPTQETSEKTMTLQILISHSSKDVDLAEALIQLLRAGLNLFAADIRCSSVDGYRLPAGVNTEEQLRAEVNSTAVLIGLLTSQSLSSTFVLFELGARWGAGLFMIPLLAGVTAERLGGPLKGLNALSCSSESQIHQLLEDLSKKLNRQVQPSSSLVSYVRKVRMLAEQRPETPSRDNDGLRRPAGPPVPQLPQLSDEEEELLVECSKDENGVILRTRTFEGLSVTTNGRQFVERLNPRSEAKWKSILDGLVEVGFLEDRGTEGEVFGITDAGYNYADSVLARRGGEATRQ